MGGWFWTRIRLGKAVAGPGVRGQDDRDKWKQTCFFLGRGSVWHPKCETNLFFSRDSEAAFGTQSATNGRLVLDSEAAFGTQSATMGGGTRCSGPNDRDKWKQTSFFLGIQRQRLAPKVRPWEARRDSEAAFRTQSATMGCSGPR